MLFYDRIISRSFAYSSIDDTFVSELIRSVVVVSIENGPFRPVSSTSLGFNSFSWNNQANVLYIDQPVGTGLSLEPADIGRPFVTTQREINIMFSK
jgi:hypothetical protein